MSGQTNISFGNLLAGRNAQRKLINTFSGQTSLFQKLLISLKTVESVAFECGAIAGGANIIDLDCVMC